MVQRQLAIALLGFGQVGRHDRVEVYHQTVDMVRRLLGRVLSAFHDVFFVMVLRRQRRVLLIYLGLV
jgi:hypothetical protein